MTITTDTRKMWHLWPRIIPDGNGEINEKGLQFYDDLINELVKYGIVPMVTVYHWDMPQALEEQYHGWESRRIVDDFVRYAKVLFERYSDRVKHWIIMNEQNVFTGLGWTHQERLMTRRCSIR